jgi:hypothetical protein
MRTATSRTATELREHSRLPLDMIPLDVVASDLDGDGLDDLVVLLAPNPSAPRGVIQAFLSRAELEFEALESMPTSGHPRDLAAADLDGDGKAEVLVAAQTGHVVDLFVSRGTRAGGDFALRASDRIGAGVGPMAVTIADVDGDGLPDLLVANGHSDDLSWIRSLPRR